MEKWKILLIIVLVVLSYFGFQYYLKPIDKNPLITEEYRNSKAYINDLYKSDEYFKRKLLNEEEYYLYEQIIENSKKYNHENIINCTKDCVDAFQKSFVAISLDHPELVGFSAVGSYTYNNNTVKYTSSNPYSSLRLSLGIRRMARIFDDLKKQTKDMNDKEKIIFVYDYVASHNYDRIFTYSTENQSAYSFFSKNTSVCAGFAKASQLIFQNIGIKSYIVRGSNHMWNYVKYEGKYYIFDATYGASYSNKKDPAYYDGLGNTTINIKTGDYSELYPKIEDTKLRDIFGI